MWDLGNEGGTGVLYFLTGGVKFLGLAPPIFLILKWVLVCAVPGEKYPEL